MYSIKHNNIEIFTNIKLANTIQDRLMGLMFKHEMKDFNGLLFDPCNSIHTFFMKMKIDVIFMDKNYQIIKIIREMRPWQLTKVYFKAKYCLEVSSGKIPKEISIGDKLEIECLN